MTIYVKSVLQLLALAALGWLLYTVRGLIFYIVIASVLALIAKPFTHLLCKIKIGKIALPRAIAAAFTVILLMVVVGYGGTLLVPRLFKEFMVLSSIDYGKSFASIFYQIEILQLWLQNNNLGTENLLEEAQQYIKNFLSLSNIQATLSGILGGLSNLAIALFSVIFILFFLLKEQNVMIRLANDYVSDNLSPHIFNILPKIKNTLFRYSVGLLAQMAGIFTIVYTGLTIFNIPGALAIAAFAAFINIIPYLGPMIGAIFGIVVGIGQILATNHESDFGLITIKIASVFAITQLTDNFVYQPLIFSKSIKAHPLEIFLVISIAGLMGGIAGMIIAVPGYSMIRIVAKEFITDSKFVRSLTKNV